MWIDSLELQSRQLAVMLDFYSKTLELPVLEQTSHHFSIGAGGTALTFVQMDDNDSLPCHYAFNIPEATWRESKVWLQARTPLLTDAEGQEEFFSQNWNAHNLYFADPDGNIGELIARHTLHDSNQQRSSSTPIRRVDEIGIAVDDVPDFVAELQAIGLLPYRQEVDSTFTAAGDEHGLFIVVKTERLWFPNRVVAARPLPLTVRFRVQTEHGIKSYELAGPPYRLSSTLA